MKYKVRYFDDGIYEVYDPETYDSYFQGTLSDCEAWIRLHENGYME